MITVAQRHKGALKWMVIDLDFDFDQTARSKKLSRFGPDNVGPTSWPWALD
jgi:hypothetical protein